MRHGAALRCALARCPGWLCALCAAGWGGEGGEGLPGRLKGSRTDGQVGKGGGAAPAAPPDGY